MTITLSATRRRLRVALAVFAVGGGLAGFSTASAPAATTIGHTSVPDSGYSVGTYLQTITPAEEYSAPSSGVITSWSYRGGGAPALSIKLKVARAVSGNDYTIVGSSPFKSPVLDALNTYAVRIPVQAGDFLGLYNNTTNGLLSYPGAGYQYSTIFALEDDLLPPDTRTYDDPSEDPNGVQLDVSAKVEADCDGDHFGDETQDPDTSSCNPPAPPPPSTTTASTQTGERAAAKKRCKKKPKGPKRAKCLKKAKKLPV